MQKCGDYLFLWLLNGRDINRQDQQAKYLVNRLLLIFLVFNSRIGNVFGCAALTFLKTSGHRQKTDRHTLTHKWSVSDIQWFNQNKYI